MKKTRFVSCCKLYLFLENIKYMEEGIYNLIKQHFMFKFKSNEQLKMAVDKWCSNEKYIAQVIKNDIQNMIFSLHIRYNKNDKY